MATRTIIFIISVYTYYYIFNDEFEIEFVEIESFNSIYIEII